MKLSVWFVTIAMLMVLVLSISSSIVLAQDVTVTIALTPTCAPIDATSATPNPCVQVDEDKLGFQIPTLSNILTFAIRTIFVVGGLLALVMLLLGAIAWITSGGEKENVSKAQNKLQAAVVGVILIAVVLAVIATLEQVIFKGAICLGLTCPITVPSLLEKKGESTNGSVGPTSAGSEETAPASATESATTEQGSSDGETITPSTNNNYQQPGQGTESGGVYPTSMILPDTGGHPR